MQVLEHEHQRVIRREQLEVASPRGERLEAVALDGACAPAVALLPGGGGLEPEERRERLQEDLPLGHVGHRGLERLQELGSGLLRSV